MADRGEASALAKELEVLLQQSAKDGLFTHAYAAAGALAEEGPTIEVALQEDGRDLFDLASLTKALVTTPLLYRHIPRLYADQSLTIGDVVPDLAPTMDLPWLGSVKLFDLLRHTSGLPAWRNFWVCQTLDHPIPLTPAKRCRLVATTLARLGTDYRPHPGKPVYSDVGFILLGLVLEALTAEGLDNMFGDWANSVIATRSTTLGFRPKTEYGDRAVSCGPCAVRGHELLGEVHDENCAALGGVSGHCGLFGTGPDLGVYLRSLVRDQVAKRCLAFNASYVVDPNLEPANESLAGWRQGGDSSSRPFAQGWSMGHLGFTGVAFWIDAKLSKYSILLTNRVRMGRVDRRIVDLRRSVFELLERSTTHS